MGCSLLSRNDPLGSRRSLPSLGALQSPSCPAVRGGGWQERTAPLRLSASGQRVNPHVSDLQPSPRCSLARDPLGNP